MNFTTVFGPNDLLYDITRTIMNDSFKFSSHAKSYGYSGSVQKKGMANNAELSCDWVSSRVEERTIFVHKPVCRALSFSLKQNL